MKNQINEKDWTDYLTGVLKGLDDRAEALPDELPDHERLRPLIDDARESLGILLGYIAA